MPRFHMYSPSYCGQTQGSSTLKYILLLLRHQDKHNDVEENSRAAAESKYYPENAHNSWVYVEIVRHASTHAGNHRIGGTFESLTHDNQIDFVDKIKGEHRPTKKIEDKQAAPSAKIAQISIHTPVAL